LQEVLMTGPLLEVFAAAAFSYEARLAAAQADDALSACDRSSLAAAASAAPFAIIR
jgi:hypothetical protein